MGEGGRLARVPSPALVLGAIGSIQFGAAVAATLFDRLGPAGTVFLRLAFGTVFLLAAWRPRPRAHARRDLALAAVFGLVLASMNLSFYEALHRVPLGIAVALEFAGPLTVAIVGSRHRLDLLWVGLALAGILALTNPGAAHGLNGLGVALALLAGGFWGIYIVLNARLGQRFAGGEGLALAMCVAALAVLPSGIAAGGGRLLSGEALALGAAIGLMSSAIPYSFEVEALRRIAPGAFGVLMSLEPAVAALAGLVVLGQHLLARELVGIVLVVIASVGASRRGGEEAPVAV
jgi:inner membrane transporter RhtA